MVSELAHAAPLLQARDVDIRYGGFHAVKAATVTVAPSERVALVGESGSGKTTLAMALAGMLPSPTAAVSSAGLTFDGHEVVQPSGPLPRSVPGVSIIFQDAMTSLDPTWKVGSQIMAVLRSRRGLRRRAARSEATEWLRRVGFTDPARVFRARPYELSGGMRQRVMLAVALCGEPRLIVADEPTSALDATLARMTMDLLATLTEESGAALLIVTHDLQLCLDYADKVLVMRGGEVVETAQATRIASEAHHPYTRGLLECVPTLESADLEFLPTLASVMAAEPATTGSLTEAAS
jgi:peptide/nickel transport system ATP-binding protein